MTNALIILTATYIVVSLIAVILFAVMYFKLIKSMRKHRKKTIDNRELIKKQIDKSFNEIANHMNDNHFDFS